MATLAQLRAKLNGEIGVTTDGETSPWSTTVRNTAISDGYAALWRAGVWKDATQDLASVSYQREYALTSIRRLRHLELVDSSDRLVETPPGLVVEDGAGGYHLHLRAAVTEGLTLRVYGWTAYKSQFSGEADTDDLDAEYNRIPLLKAKAILWRAQLAKAARYSQRQAAPPEMNLTIDQLIGMIATAEREFADEADALSRLKTRTSQSKRL